MASQVVTRSRLVSDLQSLGVVPGQVIMLHASVKRIGWVVGGPQEVLNALFDVLTSTGTLMMMASWEDNPYELERWPESRRQAYLAECPAYDAATSRADHREMGILTEYLRTWPGARRSRHPFSYVAVGKASGHITADQPWNYRDGPGSPLAKLCALGGHVLLLGSPLGDVTLLHHAEHLAKIPNKRIDRYRMPVMRDGRRLWMEFEEYDTSNGIVPWPDNYFETIVKCYLAGGEARQGTVGLADAYLFDAQRLKQFGVQWMECHFAAEGDMQPHEGPLSPKP